MGHGLTKEQELDLFLSNNYYFLYQNSNSQEEFECNLKINIPSNCDEYLKDKNFSEYYEEKKRDYINRFNNENKMRIEKKIDNFFSENYNSIFNNSKDKDDLSQRLDEKGKEFKELTYFKKIKNKKLGEYSKEIDNMKNSITTLLERTYGQFYMLSSVNEFDEKFNLTKDVVSPYLVKDEVKSYYDEEKRRYKNKFLDELNKRNKSYQDNQIQNINNYFEKNTPKIYDVENINDLKNKLTNSIFKEISYYEEKKNKILKNYDNELIQYKNKIEIFINNKYNQAKNEIEFDNLVNEKNSEISDYIKINNDLKNFYNDKILEKRNNYKKILKDKKDKEEIDKIFDEQYQNIFNESRDKDDLKRKLEEKGSRFLGLNYFKKRIKEKLEQYDNQIETFKSLVHRHFELYSKISLEKNTENEFNNFLNTKKSEIQNYLIKNDVNRFYNEELNELKKKFKENKIDIYFNQQCPKIFNVINKSDLENNIENNCLHKETDYFRKKKAEKLNSYENDLLEIKSKITDFINNKYEQAFQSSKNEQEFKKYFDDNNHEIQIYINKNTDLKVFYNNRINKEAEKFKKFVQEKDAIASIDKFFRLEYKTIFDQSSNKVDLQNKLDQKANTFRGMEYYEEKKKEYLNDFENEVEKLKPLILNHFSRHFEESLVQNSEADFINFFNNKKNEIQKLLTKEDINRLYNEEMNKYKKKFNEHKQKRDIDNYFKKSYPKIYEVKNKKELEIILNSSNFNEIQYYDEKKQEKLNDYERDLLPISNEISKFVNNNNRYKNAFESSKNEQEFINYYNNNNIEIKKYLENEDLKNEFDNQIELKKADFKRDLEQRIKHEKQEEFNRLEEEIKNDYFNTLENENYQDKNCTNKFMNYLKINITNDDKEMNKNEEIIEILKQLSITEQFADKVKDDIMSRLQEILEDKDKKVNHLNILLLGKTGAGKSTLINAILELENTNSELKTNDMEPETMNTEFITSDKIDFLKCADSRGIELSSFGVKAVKNEAEKFIDEQLRTNNPDNYIHCIWYCTVVQNSRFEKEEIELLQELGKKYTMKNIPIIIVGTKSNYKEGYLKFKENIESNKFNFNYPFIPVISKKMGICETMGLEELKEKSIEKAKDAVESACYQGVFKQLYKAFDDIFEEFKKNKIGEILIEEKFKAITEKIKIDRNEDILKNELKEIIKFILDVYFSLKISSLKKEFVITENLYTEESEKKIIYLINDYFTYCKELIDIQYKSIIEEKVEALAEKLFVEQTNFCSRNKINIEMKMKETIKSIIRPKIEQILKNKADIYYMTCLVMVFTYFMKPKIQSNYLTFYKNNLGKLEKEDKEMKEMIIQSIRGQFEKLEEKIKIYNEEINEKKKKDIEEKRKEKDKENGMEMDDEMRNMFEKYV